MIIPIAFLPWKPPVTRASDVCPHASRCPIAKKGKRHGGSVALPRLSRAARVWGKPHFRRSGNCSINPKNAAQLDEFRGDALVWVSTKTSPLFGGRPMHFLCG